MTTPTRQRPQRNPFAILEGDSISSAISEEIQSLTRVNISRHIKCNCKLPYADEFKKHYLFYDEYTGAQAWEKIGGNIGQAYGANGPNGLQNSCAARVSYGLNKAGKPIPIGAPSANMNFKDNQRYIISARQITKFLHTLGKPDYTLNNKEEFNKLKSSLTHDQVFIMAQKGHATVVTMDYEDAYATSYLGDVWFLPTRKCSCG